MHPDLTYSLTISFHSSDKSHAVKAQLKDWLVGKGEDAFVEGEIDGLDIDFDYSGAESSQYDSLGGDRSPLVLYKFDLASLESLDKQIREAFGDQVVCEVSKVETQSWMEGWKESFRPFSTNKFFVYPPWESSAGSSLIPLVIEPGMAFGTGQHATTQLCLRAIENLMESQTSIESLLDVGTGTGILSIAAAKLGIERIMGTDIEIDAIHASKENAAANQVDIEFRVGSVESGTYSLVIANILFVVIRKLFPELYRAVARGGRLLVSGVLVEEFSDLKVLAQEFGLEVKQHWELDGWIAVMLGE
ncbi:MAG: 50S ribosomal protein L11 methyltransferase [Pseudobacteriovorax sp.]|nr:50S ribosomal protein L11 methyltransferase [Pseudobacteriovorax sp.]